ncbi:MAG: helix-turn-helix domain-containing protein [Desulfonatronovibrionaceae bacterium]
MRDGRKYSKKGSGPFFTGKERRTGLGISRRTLQYKLRKYGLSRH